MNSFVGTLFILLGAFLIGYATTWYAGMGVALMIIGHDYRSRYGKE